MEWINSLNQEKDAIEKNKDKVAQLTQIMEERNTDLENSKKQKEILVAQTKGEESRYQQLLQRVEEQKKELLGDIDDLYKEDSTANLKLEDVVKFYTKINVFMSLVIILIQR